jgi:3-phosphoshikimate 1-carboxyvinyltransferase
VGIKIYGAKSKVAKFISLPGDKSIAHRALIIGSLPKGEFKIENFPSSLDCLATLEGMKKIGVKVMKYKNEIHVSSPGYHDFIKDIDEINAMNSGTTARLLSGLLSGNAIKCTLRGDNSLNSRPMERIITPLTLMGSRLEHNNNKLPIKFYNKEKLNGIKYELPVASAQVKSCILIAGFLAKGRTQVIEKLQTRDHTERMFKYLGANIEVYDNKITIENSPIICKDIFIPGDISSAAFVIACVLLGNECEVTIVDVLLNKNRSEYLKILKSMGAEIEVTYTGKVNEEEIGTIVARSSKLKGINIASSEVPAIIDEIPMIALLAAFSTGTTIFEGIEELKHKESDRLNAILHNLKKLDVTCEVKDNALIINGEDRFIDKNVEISSFNDHRIALAFLCASMRNKGWVYIDNWECTEISFPNSIDYFKDFFNITKST